MKIKGDDTMPSQNWGRQGIIGDSKSQVTRQELENMDMKELRKFVKKHKLKAKDTDKEELINEILEEVNK